MKLNVTCHVMVNVYVNGLYVMKFYASIRLLSLLALFFEYATK